MATNTLGNYVPEFWANQALIQLEKALGMAARVYRRYEDERSGTGNEVGDKINIRKPSSFTAEDAPGTAQNLNTGTATITLDQWKTVKFEVTDKELAWTGDRVIQDHIRPAAYALADKIDIDLAALWDDIPATYNLAATTVISDVTGPYKVMFDNKVPMNDETMLHYMVNGTLQQGLQNLAAFNTFEGGGPAGVETQLRGTLGRKFGLEVFANQNVPTGVGHTDTAGAVNNGAGYAIGTSTIAVDGFGASETYPIGTAFSFAGHSRKYVLTAATTMSTGAGNITFAPALEAAVVDDEVITVHSKATAQNLAFHRNAFALAFAPLPTIPNELGANVFVANDPKTNLSLRARVWYVGDSSKLMVALDTLYGLTTLDRDLAVRCQADS